MASASNKSLKRKLFLNRYENVRLVDPEFPRCRLYQGATQIHPYDECVMSMPDAVGDTGVRSNSPEPMLDPQYKSGKYFFFVFNLDNYFHFLYDTLPYLAAYKEVASLQDPLCPCKILLPASYATGAKQFQKEAFEMLGIADVLEVAEENTIYETLLVSSSFTHGHLEDGSSASNMKPDEVSVSIWGALLKDAMKYQGNYLNFPKKIYISRRTWIHNKTENIGTNYTTRRRCTNEDELVEFLTLQGYTEIFCELLTMTEKILLFKNATHIIGFIGGGMTNCIFAKPKTEIACLLTPDFIRVNRRFRYTMEHTNVRLINCCALASYKGPFSPFTRVQRTDGGLVGEVEAYEEGKCLVRWPEKIVAGFAFDGQYRLTWVPVTDLRSLDNGLNSPFVCDISCLRRWCDEIN